MNQHPQTSTRGVFLDRDGVLNVDKYGAFRTQQFALIDGVVSALTILRLLGFRLIVVTNQSAIGRGEATEAQVNQFNQLLLDTLAKEGIEIEAVFVCPHDPEFGQGIYKKDCSCRKPKPGMFFEAAEKHQLELSKCYSIGDKKSDVVAGFNAGCKTILVETGILDDELKYPGVSPNYRVRSLVDAAKVIAGELAIEQMSALGQFVAPFHAEVCEKLHR